MSFKVIVNVETLVEVWVEVIFDHFCLVDKPPCLQLLIVFDIQFTNRVCYANDIHIFQFTAGDEQLKFATESCGVLESWWLIKCLHLQCLLWSMIYFEPISDICLIFVLLRTSLSSIVF